MKRILYILVDLTIIYGSILLAFYLLLYANQVPDEDSQRNFHAFEIMYPLIGILYLVVMYAFGLYNMTRKDVSDLLYTVSLVTIALTIGTMGLCFLVRNAALAFPRSVIFLSSAIYFVALFLWRLLLWMLSCQLHGVRKIIIIGDKSDRLSETIKRKYTRLYKIEAICSEFTPELHAKIESIDEVFISADVPQETRQEILQLCIKFRKEVSYIPQFFDLSIIPSTLHKIEDIPTFKIPNMGLSPEERLLKRVADIIIGAISLIIFFPFGIILSLLIKLDGGPIFYVQERLTEGRKSFNMLKFRTMVFDAERLSGPVLAEECDDRITKLGKFMRSIRLDEVPQLINILRGDMSIVGPRPERPYFVQQFENEMPEYSYRLVVKAGLTGLAQIEGKYNTCAEDKLRYDLIYINNYSIIRDILILLQTLKVLFEKESTEGINPPIAK